MAGDPNIPRIREEEEQAAAPPNPQAAQTPTPSIVYNPPPQAPANPNAGYFNPWAVQAPTMPNVYNTPQQAPVSPWAGNQNPWAAAMAANPGATWGYAPGWGQGGQNSGGANSSNWWTAPGPAFDENPAEAAARAQQTAYQNQMNAYNQQQSAMFPTAPPQNPQQALQYQFYAGQQADYLQQQYMQAALNTYGQAGQASQAAWQANQDRNTGLMQHGMQQQQQLQQATDIHNEGEMREGLATAQADTQLQRQQQMEMMRQRQAQVQAQMARFRAGGQGSMADLTNPMASELGQTYNMGVYGPTNYGSYFQGMQQQPMQLGGWYQGMMGTPDPSSQYMGMQANLLGNTQVQSQDFSAWADPGYQSASQQGATINLGTFAGGQFAPGHPHGSAAQQQTGQQGDSFAWTPEQLYSQDQNPQAWADAIRAELARRA